MASAIGLDIGSSAVRAVQLSSGRGPLTLERLGQVMLPPGAVREGEVVQPDQVVQALKLLWQQYKFKGRKVAIGVANQQVVVRTVELPSLPPGEMRESLPFQVQDLIPIPIEQAELDFEIIGETTDAEGTAMSRVLLVAASKEMVGSLLTVLEAAKLIPVVLDLDAFALVRSLVPPAAEEQTEDSGVGEMIVNVGATVTNIVVHSNGIPRFVRILLMGGSGITTGLMNASGMAWEQAEAFKAQEHTTSDAETQVVSDRSERFIAEVRGSLDYYRAQDDALQIQRIVLTGGGSLLPGLPGRLAQAVRLPVDRGHPMQQLKVGGVSLAPEQLSEAEPFLAVAVGLAMGALE